ncbi:MAG: PaaI family thioesterase [Rhizobiaceae bacterium]|nr:PaaI family thioesterase [Rhizobiaceae bacterium]
MREDIVPGFRPEQAPPSAKWLGMEPISWDRETMVLRVAFNPPRDVINFGGVVQGGFLVAMMDDAMGFNCFISLGMVNAQASIDIHTHFLRPVGYGRVEVEARVVRAGRSVAFLEAELFGADGELSARAVSSTKLTPIAGKAPKAGNRVP